MIISPVFAPIEPPLSSASVSGNGASLASTTTERPAQPQAAPGPNPRIQFDPKLGLTMLEFYDAGMHTVTRYPECRQPVQTTLPKITA